MNTTHLYYWAGGIATFLLIPLSLSLFSVGGWGRTFFDYVAGFIVLFGASCLFEYLSAKAGSKEAKILIGLGVLALVLVVWVEMAVGGVSQLIAFLLG